MNTCRACGEPQPAGTWDSAFPGLPPLVAWQQAPPEQRYCGVCGTPACDDDTLDRLQSQQLEQSPARLYGTSLVSPTPEVVAFMAGWDVATKGAADQALVPFDLWVNRAHTRMLVAQAILTPAQGQAILRGLDELEQHYRDGQFVVRPALEDVHTNIEKFLTDDLGIEAGLAMHTASTAGSKATALSLASSAIPQQAAVSTAPSRDSGPERGVVIHASTTSIPSAAIRSSR